MYTPHNLRTALAYVNGAAELNFVYNTAHTAAELARAKRILSEIQNTNNRPRAQHTTP